MKRFRSFLFLILLAVATSRSGGAVSTSPVSLFNFQISGIGAWAPSASSLFGHVAWSPYFGMGVLGFRIEIGATGFDFGSGRFLATNYEALLHIPLFPSFSLEGGGGVHWWQGQANVAGAFTGSLVFSGIPGVDRLFASYTRYTGGTGANILRAGFGFEL